MNENSYKCHENVHHTSWPLIEQCVFIGGRSHDTFSGLDVGGATGFDFTID